MCEAGAGGGDGRAGAEQQKLNMFNYKKMNVIVISFKPKPKLIRFKMDYKNYYDYYYNYYYNTIRILATWSGTWPAHPKSGAANFKKIKIKYINQCVVDGMKATDQPPNTGHDDRCVWTRLGGQVGAVWVVIIINCEID